LQLREMEGHKKEMQEEMRTRDRELLEVSNNKKQVEYESQMMDQSISGYREALEKKTDEKAHHQGEIQDLDGQANDIRNQIKGVQQTLSEAEKSRDAIREDYQKKINEVEAINRDNKGFVKELQETQTQVHNLEMDISLGSEKIRGLREKIWESYEIDLEAMPQDFVFFGQTEPETDEPLDPIETGSTNGAIGPEENPAEPERSPETIRAEADERIEVLKNRIKKLGQVNISVLEDYNQEKARFEELTSQKDDLIKAKEELEKAIRDLDRNARKKFNETFEKVRGNFRKVFLTLFEGGEVVLNLEKGVDPLQAKIEINARPGGKTMKGVDLLSGGERALTAISLLFALYLVKPSPYCILDEVDAPLDDPNTTRFVNILKGFSDQTQFLVVTHNKRTMEAADILYGVTQQEPGISRTVSVALKDVKEISTEKMVLASDVS